MSVCFKGYANAYFNCSVYVCVCVQTIMFNQAVDKIYIEKK